MHQFCECPRDEDVFVPIGVRVMLLSLLHQETYSLTVAKSTYPIASA